MPVFGEEREEKERCNPLGMQEAALRIVALVVRQKSTLFSARCMTVQLLGMSCANRK